jgi:peptidoglycan/LPS O-acetylase OafA/YrhL
VTRKTSGTTVATSPAKSARVPSKTTVRPSKKATVLPSKTTGHTLPSGRAGRYIPGLDGLRAIAVIGVLLYHGQVSWLPGGFLGVDLFFVISGYLITSLLLAEFHASGRIDFKAFYLRRARRLVPALLAMLVVLVIFMAAFHPTALHQTRFDILAALGYFSNWWYVLHHVSYFVASGRQSPLQHLWSLGIEEQFYLVWPLVLAVVIIWRAKIANVSTLADVVRLGGRRPRDARVGLTVVVALLGAVASSVWMAVLAVRGNVPFDTDSSRLYFGTDTHASGLLIGAAVASLTAMIRRAARREHIAMSRTTATAFEAVGAAALVGFCWMMHSLSEFSPGLYRGGFLGLAVLGVIPIVAVSIPGSRLNAALGVGPLRWIGRRSYGLYLWHWPIFVFTRPGLDWPLGGVGALAARLAITFALVELSYRLVEQPIRVRGVRGWLAPLLPAKLSDRWAGRTRPIWRPVLPVIASAVAVAATVAGVGELVRINDGPANSPKSIAAQIVSSPPAEPVSSAAVVGGAPSSTGPVAVTPSEAVTPSARPTVPAGVPAPPAPPARPHTHTAGSTAITETPSANATGVPVGPAPKVTALGDSIMVDAATTLQSMCHQTEVHAVVGWQAGAVFGELAELRAAHHLGQTVIIETGTNGIVSSKELDAALTSLADRTRVVVVNDHMNRAWEPPNNAMFPKVVAKHPNAVFVDWDTVADLHPAYLASDDVHLTPAGRVPYASLLAKAAGCQIVEPSINMK